jgi:DNA mismatch repair protein MutS2
VTLLDLQGTDNQSTALIALGPMKTKVPLSDLMTKTYKDHKKDFIFHMETKKEINIEWDCRGMRLEEFEHLIEDLCGHIMAKSIPYAEIIHGHGNGILKQSIRQFLKNHPDLEGIIDPLKSDGVTTIRLRDML